MTPRNAPKSKKTEGNPKYLIIEDHAALVEYCSKLEASKILALDTEFIGEKSYYPSLELIQIAGENGTPPGLIDARKIDDLKPLAKLVLDPKREKIFHSASQDLSILHRHLGEVPRPLFDTQLAAAMIGIGAQVSYVNLVRELLGVRLKKSQTVSDWSRRPLSAAQLSYAAEDVLYLHGLREELLKRLKEMGREAWYREEQSRRGDEASEDEQVLDEERYRSVKDWVKLSEQKLAILRELTAWREAQARKRDVPRRQVISDDGLVALARIAPDSRQEVKDARHAPLGQIFRVLDEVLPIIKKAKELPSEKWPKKNVTSRPDIPVGLVEVFQALLRATAEQEQIAAPLLATTSELTTLINNRHKLKGLELPVLTGWRRELIGERLLALLDGRMHLRIKDRDRLVIDEK
ncbi:ribonuclease D [bacterium]|nr:ribonuclease D [bacterium]